MARRSVIHTADEQERDRIEADLLLLVVCAHMAYRTASGLEEAVNSRTQFIDAVRALHYTVAEDIGTQESGALSQVM